MDYTHGIKLNEGYTTIVELEKVLSKKGIPHEMTRLMDGWKIAYPNEDSCELDVVEHRYSYGHERNLMELLEQETGDVRGFLDVESALKYFEQAHFSNADGWIPCDKAFPTKEECGEYGKEFQATVIMGGKRKTIAMSYEYNIVRGKSMGRWKWQGRLSQWEVLAWRPMSEPYKG